MPTPPPTVLPCILPIINFGHFRIEFITLANPEKNTFPVSASLIFINSSKLAPAQKVRVPPLFKIITLTLLFDPASWMFLTNSARIVPGKLLCAG